ncbi:MAG: hypothetical protein GQ534_02890 [Candidatus Delongbacteria bacterium]|nr:hypothetical protein [Candidatus Delongbacteria bacterium]
MISRLIVIIILYGTLLFSQSGIDTQKSFIQIENEYPDYARRKYAISLVGWELFNKGYYIKSAKWFKSAQENGYKNKEFSYGYTVSRDKLTPTPKVVDISFSPYNYKGNENLKDGISFNFNYNYGHYDKKYDLNITIQHTSIDQSKNMWLEVDSLVNNTTGIATVTRDSVNSNFYGDIGQYEIFWQYRHLNSLKNSFYVAAKSSFFTNDYVKYSFMGLSGIKYDFKDRFIVNSYISGSLIGYAYYDIIDIVKVDARFLPPNSTMYKIKYEQKDREYYNHLFSLQSTTNLTYYSKYFYISGEISLSKLLGSTYFSDMRIYDDRDDLPDDVVDSDRIEYFYTGRAGITTKHVNIFGSYSGGNNFLMHSDGGRYLNTTEFGFENGFSGGFTINKLFNKWVISYIFSKSNYDDYDVVTNTVTATYTWK